MRVTSFLILGLALLVGGTGCRMCASLHDYCGPVVDDCGECDFAYRHGSIVGDSVFGDEYVDGDYVDGGYVDGGYVEGEMIDGGYAPGTIIEEVPTPANGAPAIDPNAPPANGGAGAPQARRPRAIPNARPASVR
jgi:hypothetical protein